MEYIILLVSCASFIIMCSTDTATAQVHRRSGGNPPTFHVQSYWKAEKGAYIFCSSTIPTNDGASDTTQVIIRRSDDRSSTTELKEIARIRRSSSWEEFTSIIGEKNTQEMKASLEQSDENILWKRISELRYPAPIANTTLDPVMHIALGTAYCDTEALTFPSGVTLTYSLSYQLRNGRIVDGGTTTLRTGEPVRIFPAENFLHRAADSMITVVWTSPFAHSQNPAWATIFRSTDGGEFQEIPNFVTAAFRRNDSVFYQYFDQDVKPEKLYQYYCVPYDAVMNKGPQSATIKVLSINKKRMPVVFSLTATDTLNSVLLQWDKIPAKPYWVGVQLLRKQQGDKDYIVLDTVPIVDTIYADKTVRAFTVYEYALRAVLSQPIGDVPSEYALIHYKGDKRSVPTFINGALAEQDGSNIRITWEDVTDPYIRGVYVYRRAGAADSFHLISPLLMSESTFLDSDSILHSYSIYQYQVVAVTYDGVEVAASLITSARPQRPVLVSPPLGLIASTEPNIVRLQIQPPSDKTVVGFFLLRKDETAVQTSDSRDPKPLTLSDAENTGYQFVLPNPTKKLIVLDSSADEGKAYLYSVASVDYLGNISSLLPPTRVVLDYPDIIAPSRIIAIRQNKGVVKIAWNTQMQSGIKVFEIYRRLPADQESVLLNTVTNSQTSYTDVTAKNDTIYYYSVRSVSHNGSYSPMSKECVADTAE